MRKPMLFIAIAALLPVNAPAALGQPISSTNWEIKETKSPVDDSPELTATLSSDDGNNLLVIRCKEKETDVAVFSSGYIGIGDTWKVLYRVNDAPAVAMTWGGSTTGRAVFAPSPIKFIRSLPSDSKLFIRVTGYRGVNTDSTFMVGDIGSIRDKVSSSCKWPTEPPKR